MTLELGIAQIGLADAESHRLRTMSGMAATSSGLKYRWVMREPASADLVVISAGSWQGESMIGSSANGYRQIIAVLAGESETVPEGCLKLHWPIRIENVVSLLKIVEGKIGKAGSAKVVDLARARAAQAGTAGAAGSAQPALMHLASIVREGAGTVPDTLWRVHGISKDPLIIALDEKAFYVKEPLASLTLGPESPLDIAPIAHHEAGSLTGKKPLQMLQWFVGLRTASMGLLPWIDGERAMQLTRYPPFPSLHHTPAHRRIAAALSRPCIDIEILGRITGADADTVRGFINAVSLCGFLASVEPNPASAPAGEGQPTLRRSLVQSFRRALGIASSHE